MNETRLSRFKAKGRRYWLTAFALIGLGLYLETSIFDKHHLLKTWNFYVYDHLFFDTLRPIPEHIQVVLIGDREHWGSAWGRGRSPVDRNQLAALIRAAYYARAQAVVVDFDTIRPMPNEPIDPYSEETTNFIEAVTEVAKEIPVILARPIHHVGHGLYERDQAFFDPLDGTRRDWGETRVYEGYIEELNEIRLIPLKKDLSDGGQIDSLAAAAARATYPDVLAPIEARFSELPFPYGRIIRKDQFHPVAASTVMESCSQSRPDYAKYPNHPCRSLEGRIVLIGAGWHQRIYGRWPLVDLHPTPVKKLPGVFVIGSYLEGIIQRGTFAHLPWSIRIGSEFIALVGVAIFLVVPRRKLVRALVVPIACLVFVATNILLLHYQGMYCDFVLPLVLIAAHPFVASIIEWRHAARNCRGCDACAEKDHERPIRFPKWLPQRRNGAGEPAVVHQPAESAASPTEASRPPTDSDSPPPRLASG